MARHLADDAHDNADDGDESSALDDRDLPDESDMDADEDGESATEECPHCGEEIYEGAEQCPACGMYLSAEQDPSPKRGGGLAWWIVLAVVGALVIAFICY